MTSDIVAGERSRYSASTFRLTGLSSIRSVLRVIASGSVVPPCRCPGTGKSSRARSPLPAVLLTVGSQFAPAVAPVIVIFQFAFGVTTSVTQPPVVPPAITQKLATQPPLWRAFV